MATIKVKFRPSAVNGKAGAVCYQLCHRQENKQITTSMRIFPHWWNPQKRELITTPDNAATVSAYRRQIEQDVHKLREIVRQLDATAARNHDIPLSVISAGMGHTSEKTTRIYLDSLNNTIIDDANRGILRDFNLTVSM